jgi:hypothetical protein
LSVILRYVGGGQKGYILVQIWKDKQGMHLTSTVHEAKLMNLGKEWRTGEIIKKFICILEYNKYMKGVDMADLYLSY